MATTKIPVQIINNWPQIPVTISNKDKKVTLNMVVDTGWSTNELEPKYVRMLGFTDADIVTKMSNKNTYTVTVKIGNLKPIETLLFIPRGASSGLNIFGNLWMRQFDSFMLTKSSITATDSTTGGGTIEGLAQVMKDWNRYTHGVVGGPILATKKQALFASSRSNSSAYWRNRM